MGDVVFLEGVPGTGKSTTAQFLARQLAYHGRPARWIYEEEVPNPFVPEMPHAGFRTWEDFAEAHVERWHGFARMARDARETIVVESYLLQRPVFTMLRRDADPTIIEGLVNRFAGTFTCRIRTSSARGAPWPRDVAPRFSPAPFSAVKSGHSRSRAG